jgi:hypothetical protein
MGKGGFCCSNDAKRNAFAGHSIHRDRVIKSRKNETLSIRTSTDIKQLLREAAEKEHRSIASMMEVLVRPGSNFNRQGGSVFNHRQQVSPFHALTSAKYG